MEAITGYARTGCETARVRKCMSMDVGSDILQYI